MRLIDADALKEDFKKRLSFTHKWIEKAKDEETKIRANAVITYICEVIMTIDNAPTVETHDTVNMYCDKDTQIIVEQIRPQGEWEEPFEMNGKTYHKCNHCHISSELILIDKFCPNCGADMRGEKK